MKTVLGIIELFAVLGAGLSLSFWAGYSTGKREETYASTMKLVLNRPKDIRLKPEFNLLTWRFFHDCFVFLLHGFLRPSHQVVINPGFIPAKPICITCEEKKNHD